MNWKELKRFCTSPLMLTILLALSSTQIILAARSKYAIAHVAEKAGPSAYMPQPSSTVDQQTTLSSGEFKVAIKSEPLQLDTKDAMLDIKDSNFKLTAGEKVYCGDIVAHTTSNYTSVVLTFKDATSTCQSNVPLDKPVILSFSLPKTGLYGSVTKLNALFNKDTVLDVIGGGGSPIVVPTPKPHP